MERSSKLADLTLVSKYYPVANYSYPRNETMSQYAAHMNAPPDRSSLGSEASAPGLIDDRSDSEVSADDDYQHNTHTSDIWNSYWRPGDEKKKTKTKPEILHPRKQYPALIPSPQHRRKESDGESGRQSPSWPLSDGKSRPRQTAATYSPFPKTTPLPSRVKPVSPSWENSRPRRPARNDRLLTPCLNQATSPVTAFLNSLPNYIRRAPEPEPIVPELKCEQSDISTIVEEEPERPQTSRSTTATPLPSPTTEMSRPKTSHSYYRPPTPAEPRHVKSSRNLRPISPTGISRPKPCLANRPPTPFEAEPPNLYSSDHYFPIPDVPPEQKTLYHQRSMSFLTPDGQPRSFFEDDSDAEEEDEGSKSFFRFHKRSTSDLRRRSARGADPEAAKRRRGRTSPTPSEPPARQSQDRKRHGVDVFGRMLGRRSR